MSHRGVHARRKKAGPALLVAALLAGLLASACSEEPADREARPGTVTTAPAPSAGDVLWTGDFETGDLTQWRDQFGGVGAQVVAEDRVRVVDSPVDQGSHAARFEVRQGDYWRESGGNRAEIVHWTREREGDERWYSWSTMFPADYPATEGFQIVTQWHADQPETQPPVLLEVADDRIRLKTVPSDAEGSPRRAIVHWRAPIERGRWHRFALRVRWSSDPKRGLLELWHNGVRVLEPTAAATLIPGRVNYLKQGLYRDDRIEPTAVVYHDAMMVTAVR